MKSLLLSLFLLCFGAQAESTSVETSLSDSPKSASSLRVIPVFGFTDTSLRWSGGGTDRGDGMSLGSFVDLGAGTWSFQTGLIYNRYGGQLSTDGFTAKIQLDYISLPLFAVYNIFGRVDNTPYIKIGVTPGLLVVNSLDTDSGSFRPRGLEDTRKYDVPASVGVGGSIYSDGRNALVIEASYFRSLTSISSQAFDLRNEGFQFNMGVSIAM